MAELLKLLEPHGGRPLAVARVRARGRLCEMLEVFDRRQAGDIVLAHELVTVSELFQKKGLPC